MSKCNIRIAREKSTTLRQLAKLAVERVVCPTMLLYTFPPADNASVTLTDLPAEVRQRILEYTDLVVPENEVEWSPYRGWYLRRSGCEFEEKPDARLSHLHPIAKDMSETTNDAFRRYCQEKLGGRGCFCKSRHTVYSSYSRLPCWSPPTPLFLINSTLRQDALKVFFWSKSNNSLGI